MFNLFKKTLVSSNREDIVEEKEEKKNRFENLFENLFENTHLDINRGKLEEEEKKKNIAEKIDSRESKIVIED